MVVGIANVLCTTLDHRQLLGTQVVFRVGCETSADWLFVIVFVNGVEIGQLFLGLSNFDLALGVLFRSVDRLNFI